MRKNKTMYFTYLMLSNLIFISIHICLNAQEVQDTSILRTQKILPILNNFRFIPSEVVFDPFITTYVKLNAGTGLALDLNSYVKDLQGNIKDTLSGDLSYISADFQFQLAVNDWLAFNVGAGGFGRLGTNTYTILTSGISFASGFSLGGKDKLWQNDKMVLSTTLDYKYQSIYLYSIYDFVKKVAETGSIDSTSSLLEEDIIRNTFLNLNYAYHKVTALAPNLASQIIATLHFNSKSRLTIGSAKSIQTDTSDKPFGEALLQVSHFMHHALDVDLSTEITPENIFTPGIKRIKSKVSLYENCLSIPYKLTDTEYSKHGYILYLKGRITPEKIKNIIGLTQNGWGGLAVLSGESKTTILNTEVHKKFGFKKEVRYFQQQHNLVLNENLASTMFEPHLNNQSQFQNLVGQAGLMQQLDGEIVIAFFPFLATR